MRKLPLNIGLPLLLAAVVAASAFDAGPWRSVALTVVIVLALWTAFSLSINPHSDPPPEPDQDVPPLTEEEQKALGQEAERHPPPKR